MAIKFLNTVQVDTDVLYVDAANNKVGIGTSSPNAKLSVKSSGTNSWVFRATAYDQSGDILDALDCEPGTGFVDIKAYPSVTKNWGLKYLRTVAELPFDVQVTIPELIEDTVWTPVIGTIHVLGDITPGGTL